MLVAKNESMAEPVDPKFGELKVEALLSVPDIPAAVAFDWVSAI